MDIFGKLKIFVGRLLRPSSWMEEEQFIKGWKAPRVFIWLIFLVPSALIAVGIGNVVLDRFFSKEVPPKIIERTSPQNIPEAKVQSTMQTPCITQNNFEDSIWEKKDSFRILSRYGDTGEPEFYGAKQEHPYQSQTIYPFDCPLPLVATISVISKGEKSIGLQFEYEGVFQVILGDGDRRAIRYKRDTEGTRIRGWEYVREAYKIKDKEAERILTHWLPNQDNIKINSQIDFTISAMPREGQVEVTCTLKYYSEKEDKYVEPIEFGPVVFKVESFNPASDAGRHIRVGINDEKFEGSQAAIKFLHFSLSQE